mmetsp:Transcript_20518/g.30100  ORF Transcript_20518/g.30100 Transcript_20518/m.30100 type:complete len:553 (-) Transcript_20518:178-1836(-)
MERPNDKAQPKRKQEERTIMRSADDPINTDDKVTLLTLPITDFQHLASSSTTTTANKKDEDELILLQLPPKSSFTVSDLMTGSARIIGKRGNNDDDDDDVSEEEDDGSNSGSNISNYRKRNQACLVVESKGCTYEISRVETSNALVLVPPLLLPHCNNPNENQDENEKSPQAKKLKLSSGESGTTTSPKKKLIEMPSRVLGCNGSVASFLEMKQRRLDKIYLERVLSKHVYDPYNNHKKKSSLSAQKWGLSVSDLALQIQCSKKELYNAMKDMDIVSLSVGTEGDKEKIKSGDKREDSGNIKDKETTLRYGMLSEEAKYEAFKAIVAALAECQKFANYGTEGLLESECVAQIMRQGEGEEEDVLGECVIRHCLRSCSSNDGDEVNGTDEKNEIIRIDVSKIAIFLAHNLFNSQTQPWERSMFLSEWQRLIPGVGDVYMPKLEWLRGIALEVKKGETTLNPYSTTELTKISSNDDNENDAMYLKYFPENRLSIDPPKRFQRLFAEREKWTLQDLEPYISKLADKVGITQAELLLKYAQVVTDKEDGAQWYLAR